MYSFYKEKKWLISILVVMLDGVIVYFVPSYINKLNYFYPMLTISILPFLCCNKKNNYSLIFILGMIYDLLYSNIFLYHALIFLGLGIINKRIIKNFSNNLLCFIFLALLNIFMYDLITFALVIISSYQEITVFDYFYKIKRSIVLNIMSVFVYFFLFKKRSINT